MPPKSAIQAPKESELDTTSKKRLLGSAKQHSRHFGNEEKSQKPNHKRPHH